MTRSEFQVFLENGNAVIKSTGNMGIAGEDTGPIREVMIARFCNDCTVSDKDCGKVFSIDKGGVLKRRGGLFVPGNKCPMSMGRVRIAVDLT